MKPVVIESDWAPATFDPLKSADYVERWVVSALYHPILRLDRANPSYDRFEFVVADGGRFSDGLAVTAEHVLATLIRAASSPLWASCIRYLKTAEIDGDRLCLTLRRPAAFYPDMLRAVDFGPTHPDGALGNGPYRLSECPGAHHSAVRLTPNPYFPGASARPDVVFTIPTDITDAPARFRRGEVDITCSTAFPLSQLPEWQSSPALHVVPTGVHIQLEPNPLCDGPLSEPSLRQAMLGCLDLPGIATRFGGVLRPASPRRASPKALSVNSIDGRIRIGYHDFQPNLQVLELLCAQWKDRLGLRAEPVERPYADSSRGDLDASLVLRYEAFAHPYAYYDQCGILLSDPVFDTLLRRFAAAEPGSHSAVAGHLHARVPVLRLFEVIGHCLINPRVRGFRLPSDAMFDFTGLRLRDGG